MRTDTSPAVKVRALLRQGKVLIGTFLKLYDPSVVEVLAIAGFDFVVIDREHGTLDFQTATNIARAAMLAGTVPLIRVECFEPSEINHTIETGIPGFHLPHVENANDVLDVLRWVQFPPDGERSFSLSNRSARYGQLPVDTLRSETWQPLIIPQLESLNAIREIPHIGLVSGVDLIFIGRGDLSASLGVGGQINHPRVWDAVQEAVAAVTEAHIPWGAYAGSIDDGLRLIEMGCQYVAIGTDVNLLYTVAAEVRNELGC